MESSYDDRLETILQEEFSHAKGVTYLDHAGATLYSSRQLEEHMRDLTSHLYGNPHSGSPSSQLSTDTIEAVRELVLEHFNTDSTHYDVIFTSGCTAALKLLAESFPWSSSRKSPQKSNTDSDVTAPASSCNEEIGCQNDDTHQLGQDNERTHQASLTGLSSEGEGVLSAEMHAQRTEVTYLSDTGAITGGNTSVENLSCICDGRSVFCYLEDNHTSVVGMRELARQHGARLVCINSHNIQSLTIKHCSSATTSSNGSSTLKDHLPHHLFIYPAQSNFSGQKYPLSWCKDLPSGQVYITGLERLAGSWLVALDAASYVCTSPLDLTASPAHFVALSFYKMFGYPTGLGALLVRSDCAHLLHKAYYGGGTVLATVSRTGFRQSRSLLHERFEDGTVPFLSILAVKHGFNTLTRIGRSMQHILQHTFNIARYVYELLLKMRYSNGSKVCRLYCETGFENLSVQGPIINFNLVKPDGQVIGYSVVDRLATIHNIHLRTGCFCNTGACMTHLDISAQRIEKNLKAGHVCGDAMDIVDGHSTGSVRISFGYMSTMKDARKFIDFITNTFLIPEEKRAAEHVRASDVVSWSGGGNGPAAVVEGGGGGCGQDVSTSSDLGWASIGSSPPQATYPWIKVGHQVEACTKGGNWQFVGTLSKLYLYPIKSCACFSVDAWPLSGKGLLYDREWMVLSQHNSVLSQKQESKLCLVQPSINMEIERLILTAQGCGSVELTLRAESVQGVNLEGSEPMKVSPSPLVRVCGDRVSSLDCGEEASLWLSKLLNRQCRLVKQNPNHQRLSKANSGTLSLANEAQYLFISDASVQQLLEEIHASSMEFGELSVESLTERFRPNLVLSAGTDVPPYAEEQWEMVRIGKAQFKVVGGCSRCQMICVDQSTGMRSPESLRTLTSLRGSKALFGVYLTLLTSPDLH